MSCFWRVSTFIYILYLIFNFVPFFVKVDDVKDLWKKLKDKHRYIAKKQTQSKSVDACPEEFDDEYIDEADGENATENFRQTFSLGGAESLSSPVSDGANDNTCDTPTSTYSYMSKDKHKNSENMAMKAAQLVGQSISTYFEKKKEEKTQQDGLQQIHIWLQLEKMFEQ